MRILLVHNSYLIPGGEDTAFANEIELLKNHNLEIIQYTIDNNHIKEMNQFLLGMNTIWSSRSYVILKNIILRYKPDLVHFHNTFPLISPAAYYACRSMRVPVVQTLHNYRLLCPAALYLRNGQVCELCKRSCFSWPGLMHTCYHDSFMATATVEAMILIHRLFSTWRRCVDAYIALTEFARQQFIHSRLPADKVYTKPNFVYPDPGIRQGLGKYALFVGRLASEKGIDVLVRAWGRLQSIPLVIVGSGPEHGKIRDWASHCSDITYLGHLPRESVFAWMKNARILVFPSICYEVFGLTIAEAFSCGLPVIASRLGAMAELVEDGRTGLLFEPGDDGELARKISSVWNQEDKLMEMSLAARMEYESKYSANPAYTILMEIYAKAMKNHSRGHL